MAADGEGVRIRSAALSDTGKRRKANEDFFAAHDDLGVYVVADGLGGHAGGRVAAESGTHAFVEGLASAGRPTLAALREAFRAANGHVRSRAGTMPELRGMATTLAALWISPDAAALGHVGDSRIYLRRDGRLTALTSDHSLVAEAVLRQQLDPEEARAHPHRSVITRALGVRPDLEPDAAELRVEPGDVFLLCTDGICAQLEYGEIARVLDHFPVDLEAAAQALIERANARGGDDNATVVLVGCER
jgi:protein phosphatase